MPRVIPTYIGIDPGASGGIASIYGDVLNTLDSMPDTEQDIWDQIRSWGREAFAVIEQVGGYVGGGGQPGSAMFKFGYSTGILTMALTAAGIPFERCTPQRWQKALGISPKKKHTETVEYEITKGKNKGKCGYKKVGGETDSQFKNRLKAAAQRLFPSEEVTLATADALLVAEYCRRLREGKLR